MFATFLRENLGLREGLLHILWADGRSDFERGRFGVTFAPLDADGALKPHFSQGSRELTRFLQEIGIPAERMDIIIETVKRDRAAVERLSLPQPVIQLFSRLGEGVERSLLETIAGCRFMHTSLNGHQDHWGQWMQIIRKAEPDCADADLLSAFKHLRNRGTLRLTKPDQTRYQATDYSGKDKDDEAFFFTGVFNAVLTDDGRRYWDQLANV